MHTASHITVDPFDVSEFESSIFSSDCLKMWFMSLAFLWNFSFLLRFFGAVGITRQWTVASISSHPSLYGDSHFSVLRYLKPNGLGEPSPHPNTKVPGINDHHNKNKTYHALRGCPQVFCVFFLEFSIRKGPQNKLGMWKKYRPKTTY